MMENSHRTSLMVLVVVLAGYTCGCTVKAIGDPKRPITINAHITIDVKGLKETASSIENYVSSGESGALPSKGEKK